jgi:hypothetical protein
MFGIPAKAPNFYGCKGHQSHCTFVRVPASLRFLVVEPTIGSVVLFAVQDEEVAQAFSLRKKEILTNLPPSARTIAGLKPLQLAYCLTGTHDSLSHSLQVAALGATGVILARQKERALPASQNRLDAGVVVERFEQQLKSRLLTILDLGQELHTSRTVRDTSRQRRIR